VKNTRGILIDMLDAITTIESFKVSRYEDFLAEGKTQDAVMFNLIIMGEAAGRISEKFQAEHPEVPWSSIIGTRNVIVHGYDQVKLQIVWDILNKDLKPLKKKIKKLLQEVS
jgi:uncharacterized protein with HEPN domain